MSRTKVAVIIPAHNRSDLLAITLKNVLRQTLADISVIVVDDGSTDSTPSVIDEFARADARISTQRFSEPVGACKARNQGLKLSDSEFVCFLDSDDLMHPDKLRLQVEELEEDASVDAVVCQMAHFEENPNDATLLWNTFVGRSTRERFLGHDPVWGIHAPLWRRESVELLGGFDESLPVAQEYDLFVRAHLHGVRFQLTPRLLTFCRRHQGPAISTARAIPRLKTLDRLFSSWIPQISEHERQVLATNYVWLAKQAAANRDPELVSRACVRARELGLAVPPNFRLGCLLAAWSGRHRFLAWALNAVDQRGIDWKSRESWYLTHRIDREPGITVYQVPAEAF